MCLCDNFWHFQERMVICQTKISNERCMENGKRKIMERNRENKKKIYINKQILVWFEFNLKN